MRVLVLGGDGFCGWPTSLYLSDTRSRRHDRRQPEPPEDRHRARGRVAHPDPADRRAAAGLEGGLRPRDRLRNLDLANEYDRLVALLREHRPDAIVHFAEQRAAPYSMRTADGQALHRRQQRPRPPTTCSPRWSTTGVDAALAHLGTMGVYGYGWSGTRPDPRGLPDRQGADARTASWSGRSCTRPTRARSTT